MNKYSKGFVHLVLIIVVVLVGIVGIGYFVIKNGQIKLNKEDAAIPAPTSTQEKAPDTSNQVPAVDLADWKTYRNEEYGFEVKYPQSWFYKEIAWEGGPQETSVDYKGIILKPPNSSRGAVNVSIYKVINNGMNIRDYFNKNDYSCCNGSVSTFLGDQIMSSEEITIDNHLGKYFKNAPEDLPIQGVTADWAIVEKNKEIFMLSVVIDTEETNIDIEKFFNQILSTFKFIENGSTPYGEAANETECLELGGTWQAWGLAQAVYCQIPAEDAGKSCTDESECTLGCVSQDGTIPGSCQTYKYEFGCYSIVKNGKAGQALCVD